MFLSWTFFFATAILADSTSASSMKGAEEASLRAGLSSSVRQSKKGKKGSKGSRSGDAAATDCGVDDAPSAPTFNVLYTMTNSPAGNAVAVMSRDEETGMLSDMGLFPTGGIGGGAVGGFFTDSTDSMIVAGNCLLAVNPGSNTVSTFKIMSEGEIALVGQFPSGGGLPTSIAEKDGLVYVMNAREPFTIQGFALSRFTCSLETLGNPVDLGVAPFDPSYLPGIAGPGNTSPSQVGFSPTGDLLVLLKGLNGGEDEGRLNVYSTDPFDGTATLTQQITIPGPNAWPYAFRFDSEGSMFMVDANGDGGVVGNSPGQVRKYDMCYNEVEVASSGAVSSCWIELNDDDECAYVTNTVAQSITSLSLEDGIELAQIFPTPENPVDLYMSPDDEYLYVTDCGLASGNLPSVTVYQTVDDCGLTEVQSFTPSGVFPPCLIGFAGYTGTGAGASAVQKAALDSPAKIA